MKRIRLALVLTLILLVNATVAFAAASDKLIRHGDRGEEVRVVQKLLADTGFYVGEIDGIFGGGTLRAVKEFQTHAGLTSDGNVGEETIAYLQREHASAEPGRYQRTLTMTATAYTKYDDGCGDITARGHKLRRGLVAVDPKVIPLGTRLFVAGYGYAIADDTGGAIKGNRIDLAFENRDEALRFGVQKVMVYILN